MVCESKYLLFNFSKKDMFPLLEMSDFSFKTLEVAAILDRKYIGYKLEQKNLS